MEDQRFLIQWYSRKTVRSTTFQALINSDGRPNISELENGSVMFWSMSENRTKDSFTLNNFWLKNIEREYTSLDAE